MHLPLFSHRPKLLSQNRPYRIGTQWPDEGFHKTEQAQYPDRGQLTDPREATLQIKDPAWVGLLRQYGRSVTVDLGQVCEVQTVSLRFLQNVGAGIQVPDCVRFYISHDQTQWSAIGEHPIDRQWYNATQATLRTYACHSVATGRYVRVQFTAKVYAFISQLEVFGHIMTSSSDNVPSTPVLSSLMGEDYLFDPQADDLGEALDHTLTQTRSTDRSFQAGYLEPSDPRTGGITHMQLIYSGSNTPQDTWRVEDFLPTIAMLDDADTPVAPLFDGALFLPFGKMVTSAEAWADWLDDLFAMDVQLHALNQAVGTYKSSTSHDAYQVGVVITLPGTHANPSQFGALPGTRQNLDLNPATAGAQTAAQNRRTALLWVLAEVQKRWGNAHFAHLRLAGLYWHPETLSLSDPTEPALIASLAQAIHEQGLLFYWIPLYGAIGLTAAKQLGFDTVIIQPNAAFHPEVDAATRLLHTAHLAQAYHTGVEIELHWDINHATDANKRAQALKVYETYLSSARSLGFSAHHAVKAYYLNTKSLVLCAHSPHPEAQAAYKATSEFIVSS